MELKKTYRSLEDQAAYHQWFFRFQKKLLGVLMQRGLRAKAHSRLRSCLISLKGRQGVSPRTLLLLAYLRLSPEVQIKAKGSRSYVAPVTDHQKVSLAVRWLVQSARAKSQSRAVQSRKLAEAIEEVLENQGPAVSEKKKIYQQAALHRHQPLTYKYVR